MFSFRARAEKGIARHIDASNVVGTWDRAEKRLRMRHLRPSRRESADVGGKISTQATNS